jgi:hypothetical protein
VLAVLLGPLGEAVNWTIREGPGYNTVSGDVGDVLSLGVIVSLATGIYRHWRLHECHIAGCHRLQWKTARGTDHILCKHHHPDDEPTHQQVLEDHKAARLAAIRKS